MPAWVWPTRHGSLWSEVLNVEFYGPVLYAFELSLAERAFVVLQADQYGLDLAPDAALLVIPAESNKLLSPSSRPLEPVLAERFHLGLHVVEVRGVANHVLSSFEFSLCSLSSIFSYRRRRTAVFSL